ncbi:MAG: YigZ family protein [Oscillospiraceae bacterium]|mgnify:CR=1 FL=1|nr:YigZ family protein [Oscillospiraceae bacterium]
MAEYYIPAGAGEAEFTEKRSSFLGHVRLVNSEEEAKAFVAEMKKKYYDARHNCWCYIIREGAVRYSDDGEPQGTAGIPMLEVLRREGVENVVCVVTRYFGGVLLGTGGLLRAYTKSAKDALDAAGISVVRRWVRAELLCSYSMLERVKLECASVNGVVEDVEYGAQVTVKLLLPEESADDFALRIKDLSGGRTELHTTGEAFMPVRIR